MAVCKDHCLSCCPNLDCAHEQARVSLIQPPMRPSHARQAVTSSGDLARPCSRAAQPRLQGTLRGRGTAGAVGGLEICAIDGRSTRKSSGGRRATRPPAFLHTHTAQDDSRSGMQPRQPRPGPAGYPPTLECGPGWLLHWCVGAGWCTIDSQSCGKLPLRLYSVKQARARSHLYTVICANFCHKV